MTQRIHNLSKWFYIGEGHAMNFPNPKRRTVILEVNVPSPLVLYVLQREKDVGSNPERQTDILAGRAQPVRDDLNLARDEIWRDGKDHYKGRVATFLCACRAGRDRIEFAVDGAFELLAVGGDLYVWTNDSDQRETRIEDPVIFTQIANRRARNPQLEMIMYQSRRNQEARFEEMRMEFEKRLEDAKQGMERRYVQKVDNSTSLRGTRKDPPAGGQGKVAPGAKPAADADGSVGSESGTGETGEGGEAVSSTSAKSRGTPKKAP